jgi:DNA-binding XRE family transcriptional regulator
MIPTVEELTQMSSAELRKVAGLLKLAINLCHLLPITTNDFLDEGNLCSPPRHDEGV